jgi:energy-coupling factor transporter ATP-binding protein EcfA2
MALIGNAPILFLDEPSSGLDPVSRRTMWSILKSERSKGKTIVLTTHFMEEADYLGDRIAIMSRGRLFCCDTSAALKAQYGKGYYLTAAKSAVDRQRDDAPVFVAADFLACVQQHCPTAVIVREAAGEATVLLPSDSLPAFSDLCDSLDARQNSLGIASYGIAINSLEDVFLSIAEKEAAKSNGGNAAEAALQSGGPPAHADKMEALFAQSVGLRWVPLFLSHCGLMFRKKAKVWSRNKRTWFLSGFLPLLFVVAGYASCFPTPCPSQPPRPRPQAT